MSLFSRTAQTKHLNHRSVVNRTALFARKLVRRSTLIDIGPLAFTIGVLWLKLTYFSSFVPAGWRAEEEMIRQWLWPAFHMLRFVYEYPHVLSATLASVLLLAAPFALLSRTPRFVALLILNLILTTLGVADVVYSPLYEDVLSAADLVRAPALGGAVPSILALLRLSDLVYYADILIGCALIPIYVSGSRKIGGFEVARPVRVSAALVIAGLVVGAPTASMLWNNRREFFSY